jgi:glycerophosphoryl diester phosphodiesterase
MLRSLIHAYAVRMFSRPRAVALAVLCSCSVVSAGAQPQCVPSAHRGNGAEGYENTIAAIRAVEGVPYVEIDIRVSADNHLVLFHDRRLSSENSRAGEKMLGRPIASLSYEELAGIRLPDGSRIPKLRAALRSVGGREVMFMLDLKSSSPRDFSRVMAEVREVNAEARVVVQCQTEAILRFMKSNFPNVALLARAHDPSEVEALLQHAPKYVQVDSEWTLSSVIPGIHRRGSLVVVKTLSPGKDRPEVWRELCGAGVDVVLTDRPKDFLAALR